MPTPFQLEIVTPQRQAYVGEALSFRAPGTDGAFEILHNHAAFLATIAVGEVIVKRPDNSVAHYATSGGFVEVADNRVVMLAETAERSDEIDVARAEESRLRAQARVNDAQALAEIDRTRAGIALQRSVNRLRIANRYK